MSWSVYLDVTPGLFWLVLAAWLLLGLSLGVLLARDPHTARLRLGDWFLCLIAGPVLLAEWWWERKRPGAGPRK